jgi:iron complex outermembrane recepter protein
VTTVSYAVDKWTGGLRWRFTPRTRDVSCASPCGAPATASYSTFDLFGSYDLNSKVQISGGIDNLFDRDPPVVGGVLGNTNLGEYDVVGRQFYLALKAKF